MWWIGPVEDFPLKIDTHIRSSQIKEEGNHHHSDSQSSNRNNRNMKKEGVECVPSEASPFLSFLIITTFPPLFPNSPPIAALRASPWR